MNPHIIYVDGCFDLFHYGHIKMFQKALGQGYTHSILLVGIMSDEEMIEYKTTPIMNYEERVCSVDACRYVDSVIENPPMPITQEFMEKYNIDLVVHGDDMPKEQLRKWYGIPMDMGRFKTVPYTKSISTTNIINRIMERAFSGIKNNY